MTFDEYQKRASETAIFDDDKKMIYPALGLAGEVGEVIEAVKKMYRTNSELDDDRREYLKKELGDVLWYLTILSRDLGISMEDVAQINIAKLAMRKENGDLHTEGSNR
ncbi:MAG: nucleoside triphosphate pyrophosphohydrolase family protein [Candidatus Nomurabacteria bacterium]|nr:nucleoside triphosphate pyrophosphohydrolase family protein [Candidatus Nomurabacteria bacterium]